MQQIKRLLTSCKHVCGNSSFIRNLANIQAEKTSSIEHPTYLKFSETWNESHSERSQGLVRDMTVAQDFLSEAEENSLLAEVDPYMKRLHYEFDHWDDAIHGYRETERAAWNANNEQILNRVRAIAFPPTVPQLKHVHVLDLDPKGYIKPHIDAVRFCGNTIAGLCLLSDCVMRLVHDKEKDLVVDVLLKRRSLYIMKDSARYDYTHEVLEDSKSFYSGVHVPRGRRISVICRNEPSKAI